MNKLPKLNQDIGRFLDGQANKTVTTMANSFAPKVPQFPFGEINIMNQTDHRYPRDARPINAFAPSPKVRGPMSTNTTLIQQRMNNFNDHKVINRFQSNDVARNSGMSTFNSTQRPMLAKDLQSLGGSPGRQTTSNFFTTGLVSSNVRSGSPPLQKTTTQIGTYDGNRLSPEPRKVSAQALGAVTEAHIISTNQIIQGKNPFQSMQF